MVEGLHTDIKRTGRKHKTRIAFGQGGESPMGAATSQLPQYARDEDGNLIAPPRTHEDEQNRLLV